MNSKDEFSGMRELTSFKTTHSTFGEFVLLRASFTDTLSGFAGIQPTLYPDQQVMIRLSTAKELINELQKRVDDIESGIEDTKTSTCYQS